MEHDISNQVYLFQLEQGYNHLDLETFHGGTQAEICGPHSKPTIVPTTR